MRSMWHNHGPAFPRGSCPLRSGKGAILTVYPIQIRITITDNTLMVERDGWVLVQAVGNNVLGALVRAWLVKFGWKVAV